MQKTIILIHGAWVNPKCWDNFKAYFEGVGYKVLTPAWPYKDGSVESLRINPDKRIATLGIKEIVDHYEKIIKMESDPPILIGHSFGGLFVQTLLDRELGKAGIAIDSAPPKGVFSVYPSAAWSLRLPLLTPFGWKKLFYWPLSHFKYAFVHTLKESDQVSAFQNYIVPEGGRIFWQSLLSVFTDTTKIDFKKENRLPLLLIAGELDHIVPAKMNFDNYLKYKNSKAVVDFKQFPNRVHWIIAESGWQEVAEYCDKWLKKILGS